MRDDARQPVTHRCRCAAAPQVEGFNQVRIHVDDLAAAENAAIKYGLVHRTFLLECIQLMVLVLAAAR